VSEENGLDPATGSGIAAEGPLCYRSGRSAFCANWWLKVNQITKRVKVETSDLITPAEAARIRGVSKQAITRLMERGKLTPVVVAGRRLLLRSEVKNFKPSKGGRPATKDKQPNVRTKRSR